jgi:hypothetical protein
MPGLVPGIHVLRAASKDVDGRDVGAKQRFVASPGHDGDEAVRHLRSVAPASSREHWNGARQNVVMSGLVPGIHVLRAASKDVDGRDRPGHDDRLRAPFHACAVKDMRTFRK